MSTDTVSSPSTTVLIVDDDLDIRQALSDFLEHEGYHVQVAGTGAEAIAQVKQHHFGAVVLDIGLPDLDGLSVLKVIQEVDPKLPVIILTAFTTKEKTIGALGQGAFAYLTKPYNRDELKATLRRAVGVKALAVKAEHVEHALSESEDRFRSVMQSATDAIILADQNGNIISWNQAAQRLLGYSEEEVMGQPLTVIMPARYREKHLVGFQRVKETGQARLIGKTVELHGLRKDGSEFPLELSLGTWKTNTGPFYSGIIRDITDRKRAQEALKESEERLRLALTTAHLGTWDWQIQSGQVIWSGNVESLFGLPQGSFVGTYGAFLDCVHPDDRELVTQAITRAVEEGTDYDIEHRIVWPDRSIRWLACSGQVLRDNTGQAVRMLGTVQDITERKRVEEDLRESQERFRQLAENIKEVFWMTDPEKNRMIYISPG